MEDDHLKRAKYVRKAKLHSEYKFARDMLSARQSELPWGNLDPTLQEIRTLGPQMLNPNTSVQERLRIIDQKMEEGLDLTGARVLRLESAIRSESVFCWLMNDEIPNLIPRLIKLMSSHNEEIVKEVMTVFLHCTNVRGLPHMNIMLADLDQFLEATINLLGHKNDVIRHHAMCIAINITHIPKIEPLRAHFIDHTCLFPAICSFLCSEEPLVYLINSSLWALRGLANPWVQQENRAKLGYRGPAIKAALTQLQTGQYTVLRNLIKTIAAFASTDPQDTINILKEENALIQILSRGLREGVQRLTLLLIASLLTTKNVELEKELLRELKLPVQLQEYLLKYQVEQIKKASLKKLSKKASSTKKQESKESSHEQILAYTIPKNLVLACLEVISQLPVEDSGIIENMQKQMMPLMRQFVFDKKEDIRAATLKVYKNFLGYCTEDNFKKLDLEDLIKIVTEQLQSRGIKVIHPALEMLERLLFFGHQEDGTNKVWEMFEEKDGSVFLGIQIFCPVKYVSNLALDLARRYNKNWDKDDGLDEAEQKMIGQLQIPQNDSNDELDESYQEESLSDGEIDLVHPEIRRQAVAASASAVDVSSRRGSVE